MGRAMTSPKRILIDCNAQCWLAHFAAGNPWRMPDNRWLPLPLIPPQATGAMVRAHLERLFPGASVVGVWS
jgi:hypothetical protein